MTEKKIPTLTMIQAELKAPKNQLNSFGHYKYRNAEDIMQGVKPLLAKYGASLYIAEDLEVIQDRIIVTESAVYKDDSGEVIVKGHAPISVHKGMSDEQAWGTASSYATKYALSKLFLLDDSQDVDSMDNRRQSEYQRQSARNSSYRGRNTNQGNHTSSQPGTPQQAQERPLTVDEAIELGKAKKYKEPNTQTVVSAYDLLIKVKEETARGEEGDYTALYQSKVQDPKEKKIIVEVYKAMKEKGVI